MRLYRTQTETRLQRLKMKENETGIDLPEGNKRLVCFDENSTKVPVSISAS